MKLRIGDKVRVTNEVDVVRGLTRGVIVNVRKEKTTYPVEVRLEGDDFTGYYRENEVELIPESRVAKLYDIAED